jgi:hypothetical protein
MVTPPAAKEEAPGGRDMAPPGCASEASWQGLGAGMGQPALEFTELRRAYEKSRPLLVGEGGTSVEEPA